MRLTSFLSDLLAMFEDNPAGLTIDAELCGRFCEGLEQAMEAAMVLERSVEIMAEEVGGEDPPLPAGYARAVKHQRLVRDAIALDEDRRVLVLPHVVRAAVQAFAFSDGRER
jgi:hypothetical protein